MTLALLDRPHQGFPSLEGAGHSWGDENLAQVLDRRFHFSNAIAAAAGGIPVNNAAISGGQAFGASYFGGAARIAQDVRFRPSLTAGPYRSQGGAKFFVGGYNDMTIFGDTVAGRAACEHGIIAQLALLRASRYILAANATRTGTWSFLADANGAVSLGNGMYYSSTVNDQMDFAIDAAYNGEELTLMLPSLNGTGATWTIYLDPAGANTTLGTYDQLADDTALSGAGGQAVTGVAATDIFTATAHGYVLDQPIMFSSMTGGAGLAAGTTYYARTITANTFQVAAAPGGAAVNFTTDLTVARVTGSNQRASGGLGGFYVPKGTVSGGVAHVIRAKITSINTSGGVTPYGICTGLVIGGDAPIVNFLMPHRDTGTLHIDTQMTWSNTRNTNVTAAFHNVNNVDTNRWLAPGWNGSSSAAADEKWFYATFDSHPGHLGSGQLRSAFFEALPSVMTPKSAAEMSTPVSIASADAFKTPVRMASTATGGNVTISGLQTIDSVVGASGNRVLLKNQTNRAENGPWKMMAGAWERVPDLNMVGGTQIWVQEGTENHDSAWVLTTNDPITVGTTLQQWTCVFPNPNERADRNFWARMGDGTRAFAETVPRAGNKLADTVALTSGTVYAIGNMVVPANLPISKVSFFSVGAAVTPTNWWFGVMDQLTRTVRAVSANQLTNAWAVNAQKTLAMGSTWTPDYDTPVYAFIMMAAATPVTLAGQTDNANLNAIAPIICGSSNTGQTTPPTAGTTVFNALTALAGEAWAAIG